VLLFYLCYSFPLLPFLLSSFLLFLWGVNAACYEFLSMVATGHVRQAIDQFSELDVA